MFNIQSYTDWNFNKIDLMMFKNLIEMFLLLFIIILKCDFFKLILKFKLFIL